eukprot:TRINITY_DN9884_c0_g1_i1.p1 TRINITY_DN9884_c0_g1~~TRINITY_DN9884_c0_g1_i1.p1  ORF type:complete len:634 (-),score=140.08 TRINITY_DN9884_c0_g1_i1:94-1995(-)
MADEENALREQAAAVDNSNGICHDPSSSSCRLFVMSTASNIENYIKYTFLLFFLFALSVLIVNDSMQARLILTFGRLNLDRQSLHLTLMPELEKANTHKMYQLMTNRTAPISSLTLEERDLKEDLQKGLWGVRMKEFDNCPIQWENKKQQINWRHTFAWRTDGYCNDTDNVKASLKDTKLTLRCPSFKSYRKGFAPYVYPIASHDAATIVNDTEIVFTYCHFESTRLLVQHLENSTVKETQEKIYRHDRKTEEEKNESKSNDKDQNKEKNEKIPGFKKLNINAIMLDGVSRPQFHRALKHTSALLGWINTHSQESGFQVFQFMRYSVMGRNSIFNLTPLVSGRPLEDKKATGSSPEFQHNSWLWDHANAQGYITLYADEQCPYTLHMTPWQAPRFAGGADKVASVHHRFGEIYCSIMNAQYGSDKRCLYDKQAHQYTFDYLESYFSHYNNSPKFSWTIMYEGHEPTLSVLPLLDQDLASYLRRSLLADSNRITMLVSDHGMHYGPYIHPPYPGKLEHVFPTLFFIVPNGFLEQNPEVGIALRQLEQALVTAQDVYSILLHLIHWPNKPPPLSDGDVEFASPLVPGAIREDRSCSEANIPPEYCHCSPYLWDKKAKPAAEQQAQFEEAEEALHT